MEVTPLKAQRKALRTSFTCSAKQIDDEFKKENPNSKQLLVLKAQLNDKFHRLEECPSEVIVQIFKDENAVQAFEADFLSAEKYRDRYTELCTRTDQLSLKETAEIVSPQRKFKLPKIELKKFSEDSKEYLAFCTQFRKIDEDSSMPPEDKFQYLLQAVVPKSKAARVVESFPASADNYPKAIAQLKDRFGREDLLVHIYVRDLLSMVMKNAISGPTTTDLPALYDELESKIGALESLGRTQEKHGDFLSPLVESCLPEEILIAWERHRNLNEQSDGKRSLEQLLNFLNKEVRGEQLVELARSGFASGSQRKREMLAKYQWLRHFVIQIVLNISLKAFYLKQLSYLLRDM